MTTVRSLSIRLFSITAPLAFAACTTTTYVSPSPEARPGEPSASEDGGGAGDAQEAPSNSSDDRLYPAEVGRTWTYVGSDSSGSIPNTYTFTIKSKGTVDGRAAFTAGESYPSATDTYIEVNGDDVLFTYGNLGTWYPLMKSPVAEGASWTYELGGTRTQTWHSAGTQTVLAGTFSDCWRIDTRTTTMGPSDESYSIWCRGVGNVRSVTDFGSYQSKYELKKKNF